MAVKPVAQVSCRAQYEFAESAGVVAESVSEYNSDKDDFGKAVSGLKAIFDSGDPVVITAIQANIYALQISPRREAQISEQSKEINNLKKECDDLKERFSVLERRLIEGDRRKQARRHEDLGLPEGVERRSGSEKRKYAAMG